LKIPHDFNPQDTDRAENAQPQQTVQQVWHAPSPQEIIRLIEAQETMAETQGLVVEAQDRISKSITGLAVLTLLVLFAAFGALVAVLAKA